MKLNTEFIKNQFAGIAETYHLHWSGAGDYGLSLGDSRVQLDFTTDRWEEGISLSLTNKNKNEFYQLWDLEEKNGFEPFSNSYLDAGEKMQLRSLDGNDAAVFTFRVLLERYCREALRGDFVKLGKGTPDF